MSCACCGGINYTGCCSSGGQYCGNCNTKLACSCGRALVKMHVCAGTTVTVGGIPFIATPAQAIRGATEERWEKELQLTVDAHGKGQEDALTRIADWLEAIGHADLAAKLRDGSWGKE